RADGVDASWTMKARNGALTDRAFRLRWSVSCAGRSIPSNRYVLRGSLRRSALGRNAPLIGVHQPDSRGPGAIDAGTIPRGFLASRARHASAPAPAKPSRLRIT